MYIYRYAEYVYIYMYICVYVMYIYMCMCDMCVCAHDIIRTYKYAWNWCRTSETPHPRPPGTLSPTRCQPVPRGFLANLCLWSQWMPSTGSFNGNLMEPGSFNWSLGYHLFQNPYNYHRISQGYHDDMIGFLMERENWQLDRSDSITWCWVVTELLVPFKNCSGSPPLWGMLIFHSKLLVYLRVTNKSHVHFLHGIIPVITLNLCAKASSLPTPLFTGYWKAIYYKLYIEGNLHESSTCFNRVSRESWNPHPRETLYIQGNLQHVSTEFLGNLR